MHEKLEQYEFDVIAVRGIPGASGLPGSDSDIHWTRQAVLMDIIKAQHEALKYIHEDCNDPYQTPAGRAQAAIIEVDALAETLDVEHA